MYSTLKRRGNGPFHEYTSNTRVVFNRDVSLVSVNEKYTAVCLMLHFPNFYATERDKDLFCSLEKRYLIRHRRLSLYPMLS